jgi:hypothetical protein
MSPLVDRKSLLRSVHAAGEAYTRVAGAYIDVLDNNDLRLLVSSILSWEQIETARSDKRISPDAAFFARWQADNFAEKLIAGMREPVAILDLAQRLGISPPTLDEAIARARPRPARRRFTQTRRPSPR